MSRQLVIIEHCYQNAKDSIAFVHIAMMLAHCEIMTAQLIQVSLTLMDSANRTYSFAGRMTLWDISFTWKMIGKNLAAQNINYCKTLYIYIHIIKMVESIT